MADIGRLSKMWFKKAASDLRTSKALLDLPNDDHLEAVVFHSQQGAEKSIKGFLTHHKVRFDKTHDIGKLLINAQTVDLALAESLKETEILTKYAIAIRYPDADGADLNINRQLAEKAYKLANWVFQEMKSRVDGQ